VEEWPIVELTTPSFAGFSRPLFGKRKPPADRAGKPLLRKDDPKRTAKLAEAKEILGRLPGPGGESLHLLMTGRYDLMHLLLVIFHQRKEPIEHLRIATLSFNKRNLAELLELLDSGKVRQFSFLYSRFFREHSTEVAKLTVAELRKRGQRVASARSHAKVVCLEWQGGDVLVLEGSANLRSNSNQEQLAIFTDRDLFAFHSNWIDGMIETHAQEEVEIDKGQGATAH
jgi:hypothetical protein